MVLCSISGQPPVTAVVSTKSGHVFEKSLIEKHLQVTGTCPITKEDLSVADLLPLQGNSAVKPRPPSATSVPGLIQLFQTEWDSVMLETFTLKQHLSTVRQELAHALYQHDAACRVIARLIKERDDARSALGDTQGNVAQAMQQAAAGEAAAAGAGINEEVGKAMQACAKALSKNRKKQIKELGAAVADRGEIKKYKSTASHPLHSPSAPGVLCMDMHAKDQDVVLTGGADSNAMLFNLKTGKILDTLKGHKKKLTSVKLHPTEKVAVTTSADNTAIIWTSQGGKFTATHKLTNHTAEVSDCTLHPSGSYLITASLDKTWSFYDIATGVCRQQVRDAKITGGYTKVSFHPDGLILGAGTSDSIVRIFDVKAQKNVANFKGHTGNVTGLSFSENGYYLASGDDQGVVKMWDLRKLQNFHTISPKSSSDSVGTLKFDQSGSYLGCAVGKAVTMYTSKQWEVVQTWDDHSGDVTALSIANNAKYFVTASKDRTVKVFGA